MTTDKKLLREPILQDGINFTFKQKHELFSQKPPSYMFERFLNTPLKNQLITKNWHREED